MIWLLDHGEEVADHSHMTIGTEPTRPEERLTYTVTEAARLLGISRNSAYEAARRGEIPTIRLGRRILVPVSRLDDLLAP
jgi:excisionase family DNA binding protein